MKKKLLPFVAAMFLVLLSASSVYAQSTWNVTSGTNSWSTATNWTTNTVPNSAGATAYINALNLTTNQSITLGGGSETVGTIDLGSTGGAFTYTIELGTLIMNNSGNGAAINESSTADGDTISAAISMADTGGLTISSAAATGKALILSGGITSTTNSNLVLDANGAGAITLSTASVNNQGTITNSGTGTGTVTLSGGVGSNVSAITETSTNSVLNISGQITVNSGGTTITNNSNNGSGTLKMMITGGVTGTGNLYLANDTTTNGGIEFNSGSAVDNTGTITNQGTGAGSTTISTGIGSAVSTITESSMNSGLTIQTDAITVGTNGTTLINSSPGTALFTVTGGVTGTGNLTLDNDSTNSAGITLSTISANNTGSIINSGTGSGSTKLNFVLGTNVTNLTENGASSLLLNVSNAGWAGTVTVTTGTLTLGNAASLDSANVVTVNGGTLDMDGHTETLAGLNGSGGIVTNSVGSVQALTLGGGGTYSYGGVITASNTADLTLTISGGSVQTLSGANTYTGTTTINSGTLVIGSTGSLASGSAVTITNSGTLTVNGTLGGTVSVASGTTLGGTGTINNTVTIAGGGIINLQNGGTPNLTATSLTTSGAGGNVTISIDVGSSGASSLLSLPDGINQNNDFTVNIAGLTGATTGTTYTFIDATGGVLESGDFQLGAITAGGSITSSDTAIFNVIDSGQEVTVTLNAVGGAPSVAYWTGTNSATWTNAGNFSTTNSGGTALSSVPGSTTDVVFSTSNPTATNLSTTLDAPTTINSLTFNNTSGAVSIAAGSNSGSLTLEATTTTNSGGINVAPNGINDQGSGAVTISAPVDLGTNQTWTNSSTNILTVSGVVGDNGSGYALTTAGSGTISLTTNNTYTGNTTVTSGTLLVTGSIVSPTTTVNGGTLQGDGLVKGIVVNSGGNITPGAAGFTPAETLSSTVNNVLTATSLTLNGGSSLTYNLYSGQVSPPSSQILGGNVINLSGGTLTFGSLSSGADALTLDFNGTGTVGFGTLTNGVPAVYDLITDFSTSNLSLATLNSDLEDGAIVLHDLTSSNLSGTNALSWADFSIVGSTGDFTLELNVVPEPGTWAMFALGLGLLLVYQRKRRRQG